MNRKKILVVDDEKLIRWSLNQKLSEWNQNVIEAEDGKTAFHKVESENPDLIILDVNLPDTTGLEILKEIKSKYKDIPVVMITAYGSIDEAVRAMRTGAYDFITKPIDYVKLQGILDHAFEAISLKTKLAYYKEKEKKQFDPDKIVHESKSMRQILEMTKTIAGSETIIVLLQGESGTGKDILAQAIHYLSRRSEGAYLVINCSAIPENLLESELFGYEKGAFTDAKQQKKGLIELAHGGTLFLDEIGTLSLPLQAKLLRFLETQTFKRVGGLRDIEVDIRVIAATNQNLEAESRAGKFRRDLFYRLNVCPIYITPLRERREDILPLAKHFIREYNLKFRKNIKDLHKDAAKVFLSYDWPGNVRELKNTVERAMIFEPGPLVTTSYLPLNLYPDSSLNKPDIGTPIEEGSLSLEKIERKLLIQALQKAKGNKTRAAQILEITRDTLRYKIKKWKIKEDEY